jgi:S-layer protein (TIGR01564 family)
VPYNFSHSAASNSVLIRLQSGAAGVTTKPAVLLVEEEDDDGNEYNVFVTVNTNSDTETTVSSPVFSYTEKSDTRPGNTDVTRYVDLWGTFAELDTGGDQDRINIYYPDEQVYGTLVVLDKDASVSVGGTTGGGTIRSSVPVTQALAKLDNEVSAADRNGKHLILVGGPYANALVEELATATPSKTWTRAQWDAKGAGSAIVQLVDNAFVSGRSALVVSGYTADDTRAVTTVLQNFDSASNAAALKGSLVEWKNGVVTSTTA